MNSLKIAKIFVYVIIILLYSCKPEQVFLTGGVSGVVSDASTGNPIENATVKLNPLKDSTLSAINGNYDFLHLEQGEYQLQVTKPSYTKYLKTVFVTPAKAIEANVVLNESPVLRLSDPYLDFGFDTLGSITISNGGIWKFKYTVTSSQNWITSHPSSGEINDNTDIITISINRAGLSRDKHKGTVIITSAVVDQFVQDTVFIYVNGLVDIRDLKFYGIVKIGTQIWMSENLNVGKMVVHGTDQTGSQIIEKYCYNDDPVGCNIYGGLYQWRSAMQNAPSDSGIIGTTRGVCPVGWHIPTIKEWDVLINLYGGFCNAGNSLIETGTSHWDPPNSYADNSSGFSALPAGYFLAPTIMEKGFFEDGDWTAFWSATFSSTPDDPCFGSTTDDPTRPMVSYGLGERKMMYWQNWAIDDAISVRCIKDQEVKKN
jgi:uncharacterized protein (TIGR02145 family)